MTTDTTAQTATLREQVMALGPDYLASVGLTCECQVDAYLARVEANAESR